MIVIDSSALVAVLLDESDRSRFDKVIAAGGDLRMSAVNAHETSCVLLARRGQDGVERLWRFLLEYEVQVVPFDETQARLAAAAYARYGKGLGSKASLNLCDCAAYVLATSLDAPLLFKGEDFSQTDVRRCV